MVEKEITLKEAEQEHKEEKLNKEVEEVETLVDLVKPKTDPQKVTLWLDDEEKEYTQKPLSYFGKLEFFSTLAEAVDVALQTGLSVNSIVDIAPSGLGQGDFADADSFMMGVAKLAKYAPSILKDCYCIWLGVPFDERAWAKDAMENLTDEEGVAIVETFIDQNYEAIESFFRKKLGGLWKKIQEAQKDISPQSSNKSKTTQRRTRKK